MRRIVIGGLLLAACALGLFLTRTWWLPPRTLTVVLAEQSPYWLPFYLAREEGYFRREGLDVQVVVAAGPGDLQTALQREPVVALAGPDAAAGAVMFARVARYDPTFLVSRARVKQPFSWSDLRGSTVVGYPPGSREQAVLEAVLKKKGVRAQYQVTVMENIPSFLRVPAFVAGTGQYLQVAEPDASLLERQNQGQVVAFSGGAAGDLPAGVALASPATLRDRPQDLAAFTRGLQQALLWLQHNPAPAAAQALGRYFPGLDPSVLAAALERYQDAGVWPDSVVIAPACYRRWVDLMTAAGELYHAPSYGQAVDPAPAAGAAGVRYRPGYKRWTWPAIGT